MPNQLCKPTNTIFLRILKKSCQASTTFMFPTYFYAPALKRKEITAKESDAATIVQQPRSLNILKLRYDEVL